MKKLAIFFAMIGLVINVAVAENVKPAASKVEMKHNGISIIQIAVEKSEKDVARVKIYDNDFSLLHSSSMRKTDVKNFDISRLEKGQYIVKVEVNGEVVYTGTMEKIK